MIPCAMSDKKSSHGGARAGAGRPKGSTSTLVPKRQQIAVRLDPETMAAWQAWCRRNDMTPSERLRRFIEADLRGAVRLE